MDKQAQLFPLVLELEHDGADHRRSGIANAVGDDEDRCNLVVSRGGHSPNLAGPGRGA